VLVGGAPLDLPALPAPWVDPAVERADPALLHFVAGRCRAGAHALDALFQTTATATAALSTVWHGKGGAAFANAAETVNGNLETAAQALIGAADALARLAGAIEDARRLARVATERWAEARTRANWAVSAYEEARNHAVATLGPAATAAELATAVPIQWYANLVDEAVAEAWAAAALADRANADARRAFSEAALAFDAITAQAPSVQNALLMARIHAFANQMKVPDFEAGAAGVASAISVEPLEPDEDEEGDVSLLEEPTDLSGLLSEETSTAGADASVDGVRLGDSVAAIGNSRLVVEAGEAEQAALGDPVGGQTLSDPSRPLEATGPLDYLAPPAPGSRNEDAVPGEPPQTPQAELPRVPEGWPTPPESVLDNFTGPLEPTALVGGVTYYRAVGAGSLPDGSWWTAFPPTPADRADLAIAGNWNSMTGVVEFTVAEGVSIPAWKGLAAPQVVPTTDGQPGYLPGGAEQIWVPRGALTTENGTFTIRPALPAR